jgi:Domain of unknown function (DUF6089)
MKNFLFIAFLSLFSTSFLQAQVWEFGGLVGHATYFGDLNPRFNLRFPSVAGNLFLRRNYDGRICVKGNLGVARVWADDKYSPDAYFKARNLSFHSNVVTGSLQVEFNFQPYHSNSGHKDKKIAPYLSAGLGLTYFNPKTKYQDAEYVLRDMGTEGQNLGTEYKLVTPTFLIGGGFKIDVNRNWSVNIEMMSHLLFTDYLDDVHGTYADARSVAANHGSEAGVLSDRSVELGDRLGSVGRQRGNSKDKDMYLTTTIGFAYRFLSINCPTY